MTRHLGLTFTDELAQAAHDGRKTQTRRPLREPRWALSGTLTVEDGRAVAANGDGDWFGVPAHLPGSGIARVGDLLWVRECWGMSYVDIAADRSHIVGGTWGSPARPGRQPCVAYRANGPMPDDSPHETARWSPSIHMPKWACRTWARITAVYPERVADISDEDAIAEGLAEPCGGRWLIPGTATEERSPRDCFLTAWRRIYGSTDGWCWVVKFERCDAPDLSGGGQ